MVALIEKVSGDHAVDSTLLLAAGTGKVSIIPGITGQVEVCRLQTLFKDLRLTEHFFTFIFTIFLRLIIQLLEIEDRW